MTDTFQGFSQATLEFLLELRAHNDKDWFQAHRQVYEESVMEPSRRFVIAMGERLAAISQGLQAVPQVNGSIFRINRDTRFSADKTPYKTNIALFFWEGSGPRMECPGFYMHLEPPTLMLGAGLYMFPKNLLDAYPKAVLDPVLGPQLDRAVAEVRAAAGPGALAAAGCGGTIDHYKKVPPGFDPDHPYAEYLKYKGLHAGVSMSIPTEITTPGFVAYCQERFVALAPIHHWLVRMVARA
jgi:uncharacterized protein (TIGR02453 family)